MCGGGQRLQAKVGDEQEEWEPVRVQRPAGAKEWGEGYTNTATPEEAERLLRYERMTPEAIAERKRANAKRFADDHALREQLAQDKDTKHSKGWLQWMGIRASSVIEPEGTAAAHRRLVVFAPTEPGERASNSESGSESGRDPHAGVGPEGYTRRADGVIIGPDGKPCRACNSKVMFSSAMKGFGLGGSGKATGMGTRTGAQGLKIENDACPPDGPAIGAATWTFLHSAAAVYPDDPDAEQAEAMRNLIRALAVLYPCAPCAYGLRSHIEAQEAARAVDATKRLTPPNLLAGAAADPGTLPEAVLSGRAVRAWLCAAHNEVNSRTGKPLFACTEAALNKRWGDGPEDGSCDV